MKHLRYLRYLLVHKWFVMLACFRYGLYWQGVIHDWSKFLPSEWFPYVEIFYGRGGVLRKLSAGSRITFNAQLELDRMNHAFDRAWLGHQHRSPHHWQHWVLREDSGITKVLEMPRRYYLEMISDWEGAGRAITGTSGGTPAWYWRNRDKIQLHPETRRQVERELKIFFASPPTDTQTT